MGVHDPDVQGLQDPTKLDLAVIRLPPLPSPCTRPGHVPEVPVFVDVVCQRATPALDRLPDYAEMVPEPFLGLQSPADNPPMLQSAQIACRFPSDHLRHVTEYAGRTVALFELCFDLLVEIVDGLNYADKSRWPKHRGTQLILFLHNLKTLESAEDRLVKGCYGDAFVLLRVPYEAFLRMVFMSLFPADAMSALSDPEPGHRAFNATNLIKQDLRLPWGEHTLLSVFTHAHRFTALSHVIDIAHRGRRDPVALEYRFDVGQFTLGANLLNVVCCMFLGMAVHVLGRDVTAPPGFVERVKKASEVAEVLGAMIRTHRRQYLPAVIDDIDDVLRLMRAADDGEDWKCTWWRIRVVRALKRILARQ